MRFGDDGAREGGGSRETRRQDAATARLRVGWLDSRACGKRARAIRDSDRGFGGTFVKRTLRLRYARVSSLRFFTSKRTAAILSLLMVCPVGTGRAVLSCDTGGSSPQYYWQGQPEPQACIAYSEQQEKERNAALEKAARELLAESPVHDKQTFEQDLAVLKALRPRQWDAIRDVGNRVDLTAEEDKALASITQDQRHALSQLLAFSAWLKEQEQQAQQAADQRRLAAYQALTVAAALQQA